MTTAPAREGHRSARPGVLVAAGVVAATVGVLLLSGGSPTPPASPPPAAAPASSPEAPSAVAAEPPVPEPLATIFSSTTPTPPPAVPAPAGAELGWEAAATGFAVAFTAEPRPGQDWAEGLTPWITVDLAAAYAGTDASRLPTGQLVEIVADSENSNLVVATVSYDSGLRLVLELRPNPQARAGWVVHTVLPVPT